MFGRPVPKEIIEKRGEPVRYWGARAIFHPGTKHPIDLLPDRQGCHCAEGLDSTPLLDWLNTKGMKELQNMRAFKHLPPTAPRSSSSRTGSSRSSAAPMLAMAISTSGHGSIGRMAASTNRRPPTPRPSGAARSFRSRPSARRSRRPSTASGKAWSPAISSSTATRASRSIVPAKAACVLREAGRRPQAGVCSSALI